VLKLNGVGDFPSLFALREYNSLDLEWRTNNSQVTTSMCSLLPDRNKSRLLCGTHRARGTGLADKLYTLRVLQAHGILQCSIEPMLISAGLDKLGWAVLELEEINLIVSEKAAET